MSRRKIKREVLLLACMAGLGVCQPVQATDYDNNTELLAVRLMNMNREIYNGEYEGTLDFTAEDKAADVFGMDYSKILMARAKLETALNLRNKQYDLDHEVSRMEQFNEKCLQQSDILRRTIHEVGSNTKLTSEQLDRYADTVILEAQDRCNIKYIEGRLSRYAKKNDQNLGADKLQSGVSRVVSLRRSMLAGWTVQEMAILSGKDHPDTTYAENTLQDNAIARARYGMALEKSGYFDTEVSWQQALLPLYQRDNTDEATEDRKFVLQGEVRWDYAKHEKAEDRNRLRLRLFGDYNVDNNWHVHSMVESEHWFKGTPWSSSPNNTMKLGRLYVTGTSGITKIKAGQMGIKLADGNVYDSTYRGVQATVGSPVEYTITAGRANGTNIGYAVEAAYLLNAWKMGAGFYYFKLDDDTQRHILMLNSQYMLGKFDFGLMQLYGMPENNRTSGYGFVATVSSGEADNDTPGSGGGYLKYYYQPRTTYLQHTMNGQADSMNGFRGWGVGYEHTLIKNLIASIEFDWLNDMENGEMLRTLWLALTWYYGG